MDSCWALAFSWPLTLVLGRSTMSFIHTSQSKNQSTVAHAIRHHLYKIFPLRSGSPENLNQLNEFKIDDHNLQATKDRWVWVISVKVLDTGPTLIIHFSSIPYDEQLGAYLRDLDIPIEVVDDHATFDFKLQSKFAPTIRKLIPVIRRVAKTLRVRQWLTKRTGDSLERLAAHLADFKRTNAAKKTHFTP
jgi:hypothetical protein